MNINPNKPVPIKDPGDIDLTRHALIEASAGTGKTYTIEHLVVRLIEEQVEISLENILLVTFTEKAAGELKVRIREKLEQQLNDRERDNDPVGLKLKAALDSFEQASVFTIHGFCQNLLNELAFENNALFETELKDDLSIYTSLLKEQIRRVWPQRYGSLLPELLQLCRFAEAKDELLAKIISIARNYSPLAGDHIIPCLNQVSYTRLRMQLKTHAQTLTELLAGPPRFSETYAKLNINARTRRNLIQKMILPLEDFLLASDTTALDVAGLCELFSTIGQVKSGQNKGLSALIPVKWLKTGPNRHACPNLEATVSAGLALGEMIQIAAHWLVRETIIQLKAAVGEKKQEQGWISFDDMLVRVLEALDSTNAPLLLERLREKYKIAFVDEFQDTDPIQWRIFRRIFIDDRHPGDSRPLIIIGDPKQAIYSFRGADVYAYLEARSTMADLAKKGQANLYALCNNWRSLPQLVTCFNQLFSQPAWFAPESAAEQFAIGYSPSRSPQMAQLPIRVAQDNSHRASITVLDLGALPSSRQAQKALAHFCAYEIKRLVESKSLWLAKKNGPRRALDYGDICILVRSKSEALPLEADLRSFAIPYSFYKKPGLFQSVQAKELSLLLAAIMDPADGSIVKQALLTPFFDADPLFLYSYDDLALTHPVRKLLLFWNDLAVRRQWSPLFQSLLEDSGLIFRQSTQPDWDRIHTNFSQIFEHLESEAYRHNLDFRTLLALLDSYRSQVIMAEEGADIHQIETEARKVQIMTMHVSKGLQFPVVFIAGGLTRPFQNTYHLFHCGQHETASAGGVERVFDLACQNAAAHQKELNDEDRRLFYVALTRAQIKLYLPYYPVTAAHAWIGPLSKFIAASIHSAFTPGHESGDLDWIQVARNFAENYPNDLPTATDVTKSTARADARFSLPPEDDFQGRKVQLYSFSSLKNISLSPNQRPDFHPHILWEKEIGDDWITAGTTAAYGGLEQQGSSQMPGGTQVGSMLHDILEQIDYALVHRNRQDILNIPRIRGVIIRNMSLYRIGPEWREALAALIVAALTTPVKIQGKMVKLGTLSKEQRLHEVEFYFPYNLNPKRLPFDRESRIYSHCDGYIRGYIDLIFQFKGRYYIADWKSNYLADGYDSKALEVSMNQAGYHLQYRIYALALLRWLEKAFGSTSRAVDLFGGVFYFYLRGMGNENQNGIFFVPPHQIGTHAMLEAELLQTLGRVSK